MTVPDWICAYHEAGHAVASVMLVHARMLKYVTIIPNSKTEGHTQCDELSEWLTAADDGRVEHTPENLAVAYDSMTVCLSGPLVEARMTGRYDYHGAATDHDQAERLAEWICGEFGPRDPQDRSDTRALLQWISNRAERLLTVRWGYVEAVAQALIKQRRLTVDDILLIAQQVKQQEGRPI
jgi:ATP-dependent Zn protease